MAKNPLELANSIDKNESVKNRIKKMYEPFFKDNIPDDFEFMNMDFGDASDEFVEDYISNLNPKADYEQWSGKKWEDKPYYEDANAVDFLDTKRKYQPNELYDMTHQGNDSPWQLYAYKPGLVHMKHKDTGNGYAFDSTTGELSPKKYDDFFKEGQEERSKDLLDRYYKGDFDLETLHRELWKNYGDLKTAFEWLAKNGRRY